MVIWPDQKLVVVDMAESVPVAYINVYEDGDIWMKIQGCEKCQMPLPKRCCGKCPFASSKGCWWHFEDTFISSKPLSCIALPEITGKRTEACSLIYQCVRGSMKGKYRRVCDPSDIFVDVL